MATANVHVERARQIADVLDSPDREKTLYEQFVAEWKAWESEDATRTMSAFDREIGRSKGYTSQIVRSVTAGVVDAAFGEAAGKPNRDLSGARKVLRDPDERAKVFASLSEAELDEVEQDASTGLVERSRAARAEHESGVTPRSVGISPDEFSKKWADKRLINLQYKVRNLRGHIDREGLILGSLSDEEALDIIVEVETAVAEVRAALQERVQDKVVG